MEFNEILLSSNSSARRYVIHQGGTGSGKTFGTLQYLLVTAVLYQGSVISVVGQTLPHLKRGAIRDFKRALQMAGCAGRVKENKTEHYFMVGTSIIEFFSADDEAKLRGARRDILFINECNNVSYEAFEQLDVRTRQQTILDYNPVRRFWVHDKLLPSLPQEDYLFVKSTYLDNKFLTPEEKRNIERRRHNANWWKVYDEGEIGIAEGVVFNQWTISSGQLTDNLRQQNDETLKQVQSDAVGSGDSHARPTSSSGRAELVSASHQPQTPKGALNLPGTLLGYGIDFGFSHSPTAIVQVSEYNGELYVHELLYRSGVQNDELFAFVQNHLDLKALAVADSAEPKTIDYLFRKGWVGLKPADKSPDSVLFGINLLLDRKLNITAESLNLIKELREYMWDTNKDGAIIRRPVKECDHAIDALRYLYAYPKKRRLVFA